MLLQAFQSCRQRVVGRMTLALQGEWVETIQRRQREVGVLDCAHNICLQRICHCTYSQPRSLS